LPTLAGASVAASAGAGPVQPQPGPSHAAPNGSAALIRNVQREIAAQPWLLCMRIGQRTVGELLPTCAAFGIEGRGLLSRRSLVPETPEAAALLNGPNGAALEQTIRGMLSAQDARAPRAQINGLTLSADEDHYALNSLVDSIAWGDTSIAPEYHAAVANPSQRAAFEHALDTWVPAIETTRANYEMRVNLDPSLSQPVYALAAGNPGSIAQGTRASHLIEHEMEHSVSPSRARDYMTPDGQMAPLGWIEEATADTISLNGGGARLARRTGWAYDPTIEKPGYPDYVAAMTTILAQAGVDVSTDGGRARMDVLLQHPAVRRVPGVITRAIMAQHALPASCYEPLRVMIRDDLGKPERTQAIVSYVAAHASA
jgi:hypothetical protein